MNVIAFRTTVAALVVTVCLVPLYAHHGTEFLSKATEMNTAEVRLGELAATKAQDAKVKEFAQMIVNDHNQALDKIRQLRDYRAANTLAGAKPTDQKVVKDTAAVELTPDHKRTVEKLMSLSGADFDREFIATMVREHRTAIREFEVMSHAHGYAGSTTKQTYNAPGDTTREKPAAPDQKKYSRNDLDRDVDAAEFATAALPTLKSHLQQAEDIQKQLRTR